jgi:hypothetical protein
MVRAWETSSCSNITERRKVMSTEPKDVAAVEGDKCRFCGAKGRNVTILSGDKIIEYDCGMTDFSRLRSPKCYETELDNIKALVRSFCEVVGRVGDKSGKRCPICTGGNNSFGHTIACYYLQGLLSHPEVRKIMEGEW